MFKDIAILTQNAEGQVASNLVAGDSINPIILKAEQGLSYELQVVDSQLAPQQVLVSRNGSNLELRFDELATTNSPADAVIEGYYDLPEPSSLVGASENGLYYNYVPQTGLEDALSWNLSDGFSTYQSLGYTQVSSAVPWWAAPITAVSAGGSAVAAVATAVVVSDSDSSDVVPEKSFQLSVNQSVSNDTRPELSGIIDDPDATITVTVGNNEYTAINNGDGTWTLPNGTVLPLEEGNAEISVTATDSEGNSETITGIIITDLIGMNVTLDAVITNDTTPILTGSIDDPTAVVIVTIAGIEYEATNNGDGTWVLSDNTLPELSEGNVEVTVVASDDAGHSDTATGNVVIDTTAPTATLDDLITNDTTPMLTGTVDDPTAIITVTVDNIDYTATNNTDGTWTLADNTLPELTAGDVAVTVTVSDAASNESEVIGNITIDTTGLNVGLDALTTNDTTPALTGSIDDATATVLVTVDNIEYEATNNGDGTWILTDDTLPELGEGTVEVTVVASDDAGHSDSATGNVVIDTTAPTATLDDLTTNDTTPMLTGTVDDATAIITVTVNGIDYTATNNTDGTWTLVDNTLPELAAGDVAVTVTVSDAAGNESEVSGNITIDTTGLNVGLDALTTNDTTPALTGSIDDATATVLVTVDNIEYEATNNGDGTWILTDDTLPELSEGTVAVSVTASDDAGHSDSATGNVVIDTTAPTATLDDLTTNDTTPMLTGTVDDPTAIITVTVDNISYTATNNTDGTWTLADNTLPELAAGDVAVTVTVSDAAGNETSIDSTITIDTTGLNVGLDALSTNDTSPALTGSIDDATATVLVTVAGIEYEATNNGDGTWVLSDNTLPELSEGTVAVSVAASDDAGHSDSATGNIVIDTTAPTATLDALTTNDTTPMLTGTVDDPTAIITVTVDNISYTATNNTDGTWTLADNTLPELTAGDVYVTVTVNDAAGNETSIDSTITIDTTGLNVGLDALMTNDTTPALTGSIDDATATVLVTVDNIEYEATNNGDGTWVLADNTLPELSEGTVEVTVVASDEAGHSDMATGNILIDTTAPTATLDDLTTNDTTPMLTGTVDDSTAIITVTVDNVEYTATNNTDGTWTLADNMLPELTAGDVAVTVTVSDAAGNENEVNGSITIDTTGLNVGLDALTTNDTTPALTGSIDDATATVLVTVDNIEYEATNNGDGTWMLADDTLPELSEGTVEVTVVASYDAGHSDSATGNVVIDTTAPTATLDDLITNDTTPMLTGSVNDPTAIITVTVDNVGYTATNNTDGTWTLMDNTLPELTASDVDVTVTVSDAAGNETSIDSSITIDTTGLNVGLNALTTNDTTPALTGSIDDATATVLVTVDNIEYEATNNGDGTWILTDGTLPELSEGSVEVTVVASDDAGHSDTATGNMVIDTTAPTATLDDLTTNDTTPMLTGTLDDPTAIIIVTVNGIDYLATNNTDGTWTLADNTLPELTTGDVAVTVTVSDAAGNETSIDSTITIDTTGLNVGLDALTTNDTTPVLTGSIDDATATVLVTVDNIEYEATNNGDGTWVLADNTLPELGEGNVAVSVIASDDAGHSDSATGNVVIDTTAPTATLDDLTTNDTTPMLTGTVDDPTAIITVTVDNVGYTATNNTDGTWTLADNTLSELTAGDVDVTVTVSDAAGNETSFDSTITIDTTGLNVGLDALTTNDTTPALTGSIDDATATVLVTVAGIEYEATNNGDGTWVLADNTLPELDEGTVAVSVTASDDAGHSDSATGNIVIDTTAPTATLDDLTTNDTTPMLTGTVDDPTAIITVTVDNVEYTATNNTDGTWTLADNTLPELTAGDVDVTVTVSDAVGNESEVSGSITIDTTGLNVGLDALTTNDTTPVLTGSIDDATATVLVTVDNIEYEATNNGDGTWVLADNTLPELGEGNVAVSVIASDDAGHSDTATGNIVIDTTAPIATLDALTTNDTTPMLTGTVDDPTAIITVTVDGIDYTATNNTDGTWTLADNTLPELTDGDVAVSVTVSDAAGNESEVSGSITIDTTGLNVGLDALTTNDTTPALTGSIDDATATVLVTVDNIEYEATNNGDGTWILTDDTLPELSEGTVAVSVTASDDAGHSDSATGNVVIDTTAPTATLDDLTTNDTTPMLTGTVDDPTATITVTVNNIDYTATNNADGTWALADNTLPELTAGDVAVTVTVSDAAGNESEVSGNITIDTTGLNVGLDALTTNDTTPALTGSIDDATATVLVTVDNIEYEATNNGDGTWVLADNTLPELAAGDVAVTVTVSDAAGNESEVIGNITIDTTGLNVGLDALTTNDTTPVLTGSIDDATATVLVTVDNIEYEATNNGDGTWVLSDDTLPELSEGTVTVSVTASDEAGHSDSATGTVVIDTTAPTATLDALTTNDTTPILTGTVDDPTAIITVTVDGIDYTATNNTDGTWTLADNTLPELTAGDIDVTVTVSDAAGNETSIDSTIIIDTTGLNVGLDALITNDTSPALTGSIDDATATVLVTVDNIEYEATNNGDGTWVLADNTLPELGEGTVAVSVTASDDAGHSDTATGNILIDTTAPTATVDTLTTNDTTPILTGTVDDPTAIITVTVDNIGYTATNNTDGTWTLADNTLPELTAGDIDVTVTVSDAAGNETSIDSTITIDTTGLNVGLDALTTNDTTPALTGSIDDATATVLVTVAGIEYEATNNGDGTWILTDDTLPELSEGTVAVSVTASDDAGHSDSATGNVVIDTTAPIATLDALTTNDTTPMLTGTVDDPTATITVTVNNIDYTATNNTDGTWALANNTLPELTAGDIDVTVTVSDAAGNETSIDSTITIDTTGLNVGLDALTTNDTTPSLTGSIDDATATVLVTVAGIEYEATNNGDGTWILTDDALPELGEGTVAISVTASDDAGHSDTATGNVVIDTTAPTATLNDLTTNDTTPMLTGTVDDPTAIITVTVNNIDYTATNNTDGTWILADNTLPELTAGDVDVTVTVSDAAGNESEVSGSITIDTTGLNVGLDALTTNDTTPVLTGSIDDATATVLVTVDNIEYEATNNGDGTWVLSDNTLPELGEGNVAVSVTASDDAGHSDSATGNIVIDTTAPTATVDDLITNDTTPTLTGTVDDPTAIITVTVDNVDYTATNNTDGTWTLADNTLPELTAGDIDVTVTVSDAAGNESEVSGRITIDTTGLNVGLDALTTNDTTPALTGSIDDATATVLVTVAGIEYEATNNGDGTWVLTDDTLPELGEGTVAVSVTASDEAGHSDSATGNIVIDTTAPTATLDALTTNDTTPMLTGTVDDPTAIITVTVDNISYTATNNTDGTWTLADNTLPELTAGDVYVTVTVNDAAGNETSIDSTITIDTTGLNVGLDGLTTNDTTPALTGSIDDATATVLVTVDNIEYEATNNGDGTWVLADNTLPELDEGTVAVSVTVSDDAGHSDSATGNIVIDTTAPTATLDDLTTNDTTPMLTGTVDDPTAIITVTVNGIDYTATNNTDGTWTLVDNTLPELAAGDVAVTVTVSDAAGNDSEVSGSITIDTTGLNVGLDALTTNDTTPALTGSVDDATAMVLVTVDNIEYEATNNGDGTWALADNTLPELSEGTVAVSVTASDDAGHSDTATGNVVIDTTAPTATLDDLTTNDTTPMLTGTVDDPTATITVTVDNVEYTATNNTDGTWTLADNTLPELAEGDVAVTVTVSDAAGNESEVSGSITIDTTGLNVGLDALTTNDTTPALTGSIDDATATVLVTVDNIEYEATNNGDGTWILTDDTLPELSEGTVTVSVTASDDAGHSDSATGNILIDTTAPIATLDALTTNDTTPMLTGTVDDPTAIITVTVDNIEYTATNNTDGTWTLADNTLPELTAGDVAVSVTVNDAAGNESEVSGSITIDTTGLNVGLDALTTNDTTPALTGSIDDATATVLVTVDNIEYEATNNGDGTWILTDDTLPELGEGTVEVTVVASDDAGHSDTATGNVVIDTTAPTVTLDDLITNDTTPMLTGTVDDPAAIITVTVDNIEYTAINNTDGTWTLADNTLPELTDGDVAVSVTVSDAAGNDSEVSGSITIDTTGLNVGLDALTTNDTTPALTGSIDDATATVLVTVDNIEYEATNNGDGTWVLADNTLPELDEGTVAVSVTASDDAGHSDSATGNIVIDTTAPTATLDDLITNDTTPMLTGTVDDPTAIITVTVDNVEYTATNNTDGTWTLADNTLPELTAGDVAVTVTVSDTAGNESEVIGNITIDTTGLNVGLDALTTNDTTPALTGSIDDATATVLVTVAGIEYEATNNGDGTWVLADNTLPELGEGNVAVSVTASDDAGHSDSATGNILIDTTVPTATLDDLITNDTTPMLTGTVDDPTAVITVTVDNVEYTATNNTDGTWTLADNTLSELTAGDVDVTVTVSDAAGNETSIDSTITIDTTGLNVGLDVLTTNDTTPALTGSIDDATATVLVTVDNIEYEATNNGDGTWILTDDTLPELGEGTVEVTVVASDDAGHSDTATGNIVIDTTAPIATLDALTTNDTTPMLTGTVDDPTAIITVMVDNVEYTATNNTDGTWTLADNTLPELTDGDVAVSVTVSDAAGNENEVIGNITIDTTGLNVGLDALTTNDTTPALTGAIDDATATVLVTVDNIEYEATNNGDGTWVLSDNTLPELGEGTVAVSVTASDDAGHSDSATGNIVIDTTAPTATLDDLTTNDTTPMLTGTVDDPTAIITVTVNGIDYTVTNNTDGTWTLVDNTLPELAAGDVAVTVTVSDAAGNESEVIGNITIDTTAPIVSVESLITSDSTPALTGSVDDVNAAVTVTVNEVAYIATNNGDGTWTLADDSLAALSEGEISVSVVATDSLGNNSDSATGTITLDTTAPIVSVESLITSDSTPALTGSVDDVNAAVTVTVNEVAYTATNNGDGTWTLADDSLAALSEGEISVSVVATDSLGNNSDSATGTITLDTTAPIVSVESLSTNDSTPELTGSVDDVNAVVTVSVNEIAYTATNNGDGTWTLANDNLAALSEGEISVSVVATDSLGNNSDSATGTITLDTTAPVVSVDSLITNDSTPALTGSVDDVNAAVTVTVNEVAYTATNNGDGTWTLADDNLAALSEGDISVSVVATDSLGNSSESVTGTITLDTTAPVVSVESLITSDSTPALTGSIDDVNAAVTVTVNEVAYTATNNGDGTWTLADDNLAALSEGDVSVSVVATDSLGNSSESVTGTITLDTTAPVVSVESLITSDSTPALTGSIDDVNAAVTVTVNEVAYTATNNGDGTWTLADDNLAALSEGDVSVSVVATDSLGNNSDSATGTITLDTTAPIVSVDSLITNDSTPALTGSVDDVTATVLVTVDNIEYEATNNGDGTWTLADDNLAALSEGEISVSAVATDSLDNNSDSATGTITLDTTAPIVSVDSLITNDSTPALTGSVDDVNAAVTVTVNEVAYTATNNGDGTWTLADNNLAALSEGEISVSVVATDSLDNNSDSATGTITLDTTAPIVSVESLSTNDSTPELTGSVDNVNAVVTVTVNEIAYTATNNGEGTWTLADNNLAALSEGEISVSVVATDSQGNNSDSATGTITLDTTAPIVSVDSLITNNSTPALTGSVDDVTATVLVTVDNIEYEATNNGDGTWTLANDNLAALSEGEISVSVVATDSLDNNSDSATGTITLDTTAPIVSVGSLFTNDSTPALTGSVDDVTATVLVTVDNIEYEATNNGDGTWTLADNNLAALSEGEFSVSVVATDSLSNNSDSATGTITLDTTAPIVSVDSLITSDSTPALTGSVDDVSAVVTVTVNEVAYTATNNGDGTWTLADDNLAALSEGEISASVVATDSLGNNSDSATGTITLDTTAPVVNDQLLAVSESDLVSGAGVSGSLTISEELSSLSLNVPTETYTSQGENVTWVLTTDEEGKQTLTGSTTSAGSVAILTLDSVGDYDFTLLAPFDHLAQGNDELLLSFEVESIDVAGNAADNSLIVVNVTDDIPSVNVYQQEIVDTVNTTYSGDIILDAGADGVTVSTITLDGFTFSYDAENDEINTYGSSDLVKSFEASDYDSATQILTIETIKGETITVDMSSGEYTYVTTGIADIDPVSTSAPEVALGSDDSLLGLVGVDALNLINFSEDQAFSASDADNDITQVVISTGSFVSVGISGFAYSTEMAEEFGLTVESVYFPLVNLLGSSATLTITVDEGSVITNQQLNEFLGSIYWDGSLVSVDLLSALTIEATDSEGQTTTATSTELLDVGLLSSDGTPEYLIEGDDTDNTALTGTADSDRIYGYAGDDALSGGEAADILRGGAGSDTLDGGSGNDIIIGGIGNDTLTGDTGNDIFSWETVDVASVDIITDFNMSSVSSGGDIIDLAELLDGEGKIGSSGAGNLTNFLHFEFDGTDTTLYISSDGDFQGGYDVVNVDQSIVFNDVDITTGLTTDQDIIENLLESGNLLVDDLAVGDDVLGGTTTIDVEMVDGDGDAAQATVDFESSGAEPDTVTSTDNSAPMVSATNTSLLGLVSVQALNIINLDNQALTAFDVDGNLTSVELNYQSLLDVSLATLTLDASSQMAAELGLQIEVVNDSGLLGLVVPSSTLTITAIDGGNIDNQAINELLATVQFYDNDGLLNGALELNVQADVLNNLTITATDSEGASNSSSLGDLVSADALNDILFDIDTIKEGDSGQNNVDYSANTSGLRLYGYGDDDQLIGGSGNDLIRGGSGDDSLTGGAGNDLLIDGNGADTFDAGEGDDLISISGTQFTSIDGGTGSDTLMLDDGLDLDLSDVNLGAILNIESIDLSDGESSNVLTLTEQAVKDLTEEDDTLVINGDMNDSVEIQGATLVGSSLIDGVSYNEYHLGTTTLFVDEEVGATI